MWKFCHSKELLSKKKKLIVWQWVCPFHFHAWSLSIPLSCLESVHSTFMPGAQRLNYYAFGIVILGFIWIEIAQLCTSSSWPWRILQPLLKGLKPRTFWSQVRHSNHWAVPAPQCNVEGSWTKSSITPGILVTNHMHILHVLLQTVGVLAMRQT